MAYQYISIFEREKKVTKEALCTLLGLDLTRPNLVFTKDEISAAFKQRALRSHPDRQRNYNLKLSKELCDQLMNDLARAKDELIEFKDDSQKEWFDNINLSVDSKAVIAAIIGVLNGLHAYRDTVDQTVNLINLTSYTFLALWLLARFSDDELNLRYLNRYMRQLSEIRHYMNGMDSSSVKKWLHFLRDQANNPELFDEDELRRQLNKLAPELATILTEEGRWEEFVLALNEARDDLDTLLTDEFINKVQHLIRFWSEFIVVVPSWKQLILVYFMTLLFTANSLPKYANALKVLSETVLAHKGQFAFSLIALPMLALAALLLPINIAINLAKTLALQGLETLVKLGVFVPTFLASSLTILSLIGTDNDQLLVNELVNLTEATFNSSVRLALNVAIEMTNAVLYILLNRNVLYSFKKYVNDVLDEVLNQARTSFDPGYPTDKSDQDELALVVYSPKRDWASVDPQQEPTFRATPARTGVHFFSSKALANQENSWLRTVLTNDAQEDDLNTNRSRYSWAR